MAVEQFLSQKMVENLGFQPTEDQQRLFDILGNFIMKDYDTDIHVVSGYAGTGKTSAIAAFVKTLKQFGHKFILLAPTGRSAKVLSGFTGENAFTIHKHIYRQKSLTDGLGQFKLDINKYKNTFFIVDEASLITISSINNIFGSGDLLNDLVEYVRSNEGNSLVIIGDKAQLPPIGLQQSPALDNSFMTQYGEVIFSSLTQVVRQAQQSGILYNATVLRHMIENEKDGIPHLKTEGFEDVIRIKGGDLIETLSDEIGRNGLDNIVVLCRSNKRANRYNAGIRSTVLYREESLTKGDKLMVVKNCYQFMGQIKDPSFFIANGDIAELQHISKYEERYGIHFAEAVISLPDYDNVEITSKVILDTLGSEAPALTKDEQQKLFDGVYADYEDIKTKKKRYSMVREDPYFNALQIKYATAITCHKSQGGQWSCVFIDNPFWKDDISLEDLKWLYTAITRGVNKVYFINFDDKFFAN